MSSYYIGSARYCVAPDKPAAGQGGNEILFRNPFFLFWSLTYASTTTSALKRGENPVRPIDGHRNPLSLTVAAPLSIGIRKSIDTFF